MAATSAAGSSGATTNPKRATDAAICVPGAARATVGRPDAIMPVSFDGITRSAAPASCGRR